MSEQEASQNEPWAKRHQLVVDEFDEQLLDRARAKHRMVAWWWGHRNTEDGNGALCYICDRLVSTWDRRWPMTEKAKHEVAAHKAEHITKHLFEDDMN